MTMVPQQQEGYFYGVLDIYYALMFAEETATTAPKYGTPAVLAKTIEVGITPNYKEGKVYASNTATRNEKRVNTYTVSLNLDKIPITKLRELLGRATDKNGVQLIKDNQVAPNVAIAFAITLDDGSKELWWLYKGKFAEPGRTAKTEGESIEYQHPTIEGVFVRRSNDHNLAAIVDTSDKTVAESVATDWFQAVYEPAA